MALAIAVICSRPSDDYWKNVCNPRKEMRTDLAAILGRVVFVGQAGSGSDIHQSLIGNVPGVILQANYVESLLDDRVFKPMRSIYQIVIGLFWLGGMFWVSLHFRPRPALALFLSLLAAVIPAYLIHLLILHFNYYTQLLLPLILAAIVLNVSRQIESVIAHQESP